MPNIEVVPLVKAQIDNAVQVLALAFQDDPFFIHVLPKPEERARRLPGYFARDLGYGHLVGEVFTTKGTPEGVAVWMPPKSEMTAEPAVSAVSNGLSAILGADAAQRLGRVFDYLTASHNRDVPSEHWYLAVIGVVPTQQRQGIGRALLQPILNCADAAGLPCCLDTAELLSVRFYQKLGFRVLIETIEPESSLRLWTLQRDAC